MLVTRCCGTSRVPGGVPHRRLRRASGLEQVLYDRYPGAQVANGGFNRIRGISPSNPNLPSYMQSAWDFLERLGL